MESFDKFHIKFVNLLCVFGFVYICAENADISHERIELKNIIKLWKTTNNSYYVSDKMDNPNFLQQTKTIRKISNENFLNKPSINSNILPPHSVRFNVVDVDYYLADGSSPAIYMANDSLTRAENNSNVMVIGALNELINASIVNERENATKNNKIEVTCSGNGELIITGNTVQANDVKLNLDKCEYGIQKIKVFADISMNFDADLIIAETDFSVIAPTWRVIGERVIDLSGRSGKKLRDKVKHMADSGAPGSPGSNAGNFIGVFSNLEDADKLTIKGTDLCRHRPVQVTLLAQFINLICFLIGSKWWRRRCWPIRW